MSAEPLLQTYAYEDDILALSRTQTQTDAREQVICQSKAKRVRVA